MHLTLSGDDIIVDALYKMHFIVDLKCILLWIQNAFCLLHMLVNQGLHLFQSLVVISSSPGLVVISAMCETEIVFKCTNCAVMHAILVN